MQAVLVPYRTCALVVHVANDKQGSVSSLLINKSIVITAQLIFWHGSGLKGAGENVAFLIILTYLRAVAADIAADIAIVWMPPVAWNGIRQHCLGTVVWKSKAYQHGCLRCSLPC